MSDSDIIQMDAFETKILDNYFNVYSSLPLLIWYLFFFMTLIYFSVMTAELTLTMWKYKPNYKTSNKEGIVFISEKCPICMDVQNNPVRVNCGHLFCQDCIETMFAVEEKFFYLCPICRCMIEEVQLIQPESRNNEVINQLNDMIHRKHILPVQQHQIRIFVSVCFILLLLRFENYVRKMRNTQF